MLFIVIYHIYCLAFMSNSVVFKNLEKNEYFREQILFKKCPTCLSENSFWDYRPSKLKDGLCDTCIKCSKQHPFETWKLHPFWIFQNKDKYNEIVKQRKLRNKQRNSTSKIRINQNIRKRIRKYIKGSASKRTAELVGCSSKFLVKWLENQFTEGMTWENYGTGYLIDENRKHVYDNNGKIIKTKEWNIDHVIPMSKFNLEKEEEVLKCSHYTNLQPMWAVENYKKSNKI